MNLPVLPGVSIRLIQRIVCDRFKLPLDVMQSPSRKHDDAHPRQLAMRLSREFTGKSLLNIGRHFGGRDHTTVIHAIRAVERRNRKSADARQAYLELRAALEMISPQPVQISLPDLYAELGLQLGATEVEIDRAYRVKAKAVHPDAGGSRDEWDRLCRVYDRAKESLLHPQSRTHP